MKRRNKIRKANALLGLMLVMLTVTMPFSSALFDWSEESQEEDTGESILVNVKGYEPEILPSSLIEDGDVPVYVYLTGLTPGKILGTDANAEPLYGNVKIKNMFTRPLDQETLDYVRGSPKYIEPRQYSLDNLGYLVVTLKQIDREAEVPEQIDLNMKADITFENADRLYSMIEQDLVIPESPDEGAWRQDPDFNEYRFFAGRGAIRASSIGENSAELTVYGGQDLQWPFTGTPRPLKDLSLDKGETSSPIRMSAASDFMTNAFRVKLTDITDPSQKRAKIRVNINGEEREYVVTEGSRLYPGSSLTVQEINVVRRGPGGRLVTYELVVKGPKDESTASKSFIARAGEMVAGVLGYVSEEAAEAVTEATRDEYQAGVATATTTAPNAGDVAAAGSGGQSASTSGTASFIARAGEMAAGVLGYVSDDAAEAVTEATRDEHQAGVASTSRSQTSFVVMSDIHTNPSGGKPQRTGAVSTVELIHPGFVIMTGDIIYSDREERSGITPLDSSKSPSSLWQQFNSETWENLNSAGIPVLPVAGNHDMETEAMREAYENYWNAHKPNGKIEGEYPYYYSFDSQGTHYVALESWKAAMSDEQLNWLSSDLTVAKNSGKKTIVFSHLTLTKIKKGSLDSAQLEPNARLKQILKAGNVISFIHGDTHIFYEGVTDGIKVVSAGPVGGASRYIPGTATRTPYMIVPVEVSGNNVNSYGLVYPGYTERFDESVFAQAYMPGYTTSRTGAADAIVDSCSRKAAERGKAGSCRDSCFDEERETEWALEDGPFVQLCNEGLKCCMTTETVEPEVTDEEADWGCTQYGGVCTDSRENDCYDSTGTIARSFVSGKCLSNMASWYKCCPGGNAKSKAQQPSSAAQSVPIAAGGEGICAGKVVLLRDGNTAEEWNETISKSTQEQIYCTAAEEFKRIAELYPGLKDDEGTFYEDKAYYMLGEIYYWLGDSTTALKYYKMAVRNNIGGFVPLAQARVDELEEEARLHTTYSMSEFEENGVSVRVKLLDVLWQNEADRPKATIDVENEGTKKLEVGNDIFGSDFSYTGSDRVARKYNWQITQINSESVIIEKKFRDSVPPDYRVERKSLPLKSGVMVDNRNIRLKSVDLKKFAIVTIIPGTGAPLKSQTNFTVHIPLEKRAISLTPDEISSQINSTQEIINDLNEVIGTLNDVVVTWKKVCLGTFLFLTLKNSFFTGLARTQARRMAMHGPDGKSGWDQYCRANSGEGRLYDNYEDCIIDNSGNIESTVDAAQDAVEKVNDEMEDYRSQQWYKELASDYPEIDKYGPYVGDELFDPQQLRDYRYWQLMSESSVYSQLSGEREGSGYEYNFRQEVDENLASFNLGNEEKEKAYADAVGDINANYPEFSSLSDQDREVLFNDLYGSHLAAPDTHSNDFPYVEELGVTPLATIRRENRELYSNTPNGKVTLREASIQDYDRRLNAEIYRLIQGSEQEVQGFQWMGDIVYGDRSDIRKVAERSPEGKAIMDEMERVEGLMEGNAFMPLRTNQGQVYADENNQFYVAMTAAYATGRTRNDYDPAASAEFYPDGKPYCVPTGQGNLVKVLDFYRDGSPSIVQEWNVGDDGFLCTDDDVLVRHQSMLERPEQESSHRSLVETATRVGARHEGEVISAAGRQFAVSTSRSSADNARTQPNCYDTMDPDDCRLLFGVCDPVMCPPSRFNLGGTWQVNDVVQTGIIGSTVLGLPNFDIPYEPVPICLTGVLAGLQNINSVLKGYVQCLKTAEINGQSVGICDKIRSVFVCELLWKEAIAIINIKGGLFNWVSQTFFGQERGGGEYLTFESSLENVEDSFSFFTTQYATTAFASYQARSTEEIGTEICKQAIFGKVPALGEFFDQIAQPESPPQYTALVTEIGYSETMGQSRYETFYHIYAGEDNDATYSVFLKNSITGDAFYTTERCYGRQGTISKGGIASFNLDCVEAKGYDQVCITLNGNTQCGFGKVSTSFALNYLTDLIVSDEALRQIDSEDECYPSSPVTSPSLGSLPLPGNVEVLSSGIQRVCSLQNPGSGTNPIDWKEVGTCGKDSTGRSLGSCWIDMRTVSVHDTERMADVTNALDEAGLRERKEYLGISDLLEEEDSAKELERLKGLETETCQQKAEAMKLYRELETRTIVPKIGAEAGYRYSVLMHEAAAKCAKYDLKREVEKLKNNFEYDIAGIHAGYSIRMQDEVIGKYRGAELEQKKLELIQEFRADVQEAYMAAREKLNGLQGMDSAGNVEKYGSVLDDTYFRYYNLQVPFIVEEEREELASESRAMELKCQACGNGAQNSCDEEECYGLGACYFKPGTVTNVFSSGNVWNECHACGMAQSCDVFNVDMSKCGEEQCMGAAGLSCGEKYGKCSAVEPGEGGISLPAGGNVAFTTAAAPITGNVVDYGDFVKLAGNKAAMTSVVALPRPATEPTAEPTFSQGTIAVTVYYTASCEDKPGWADGTMWYTGYWDNPETILATNPKECTSDADCRSGTEECKSIGGKKVCWWQTPCKMKMEKPEYNGFYEETKCEGSSVCKDKVYNYLNIGTEPFTGGEKKTATNARGSTATQISPEIKRTLAVNPNPETNCYIPYGSLVYMKFAEGNQLNGWYYAEDTGGGFRGKCKIDMYAGVGRADLNAFMALNPAVSGRRNWRPEVWVYPPRAGEGTMPAAAEDTAADNQYCNTCGGSSIDFDTCDANECHGLGPCYFTAPNSLGSVGGYSIRNPFSAGKCTGCAQTTRCSDFNGDSAMCNAAGCTGRAGLSCEYKNGECAVKTAESSSRTLRSEEEPDAELAIGVMGDSITKGTLDGGYVKYLNDQCKEASVAFVNHGVVSDSTTRMKNRFQNDIIAHNYDEVIIMGGANNICNGARQVEEDLAYMYSKAQENHMTVVALTITPFRGYSTWSETCQRNLEEVNRWIMRDSEADTKIDVYSILEDPESPDEIRGTYDSGDHLHLSPRGQQILGKAVFDAAYKSVCS